MNYKEQGNNMYKVFHDVGVGWRVRIFCPPGIYNNTKSNGHYRYIGLFETPVDAEKHIDNLKQADIRGVFER